MDVKTTYNLPNTIKNFIEKKQYLLCKKNR